MAPGRGGDRQLAQGRRIVFDLLALVSCLHVIIAMFTEPRERAGNQREQWQNRPPHCQIELDLFEIPLHLVA
jgi:hypothetical protein